MQARTQDSAKRGVQRIEKLDYCETNFKMSNEFRHIIIITSIQY